jgi:hypothetical protein
MVGERRRDVLHYVPKSRAARGDVRDDRLDRVVARKRPSERRSSTSNAADELSRVVRDIERDTNSSGQPKAKGNDNEGAGYSYRSLFFDKCIRAECATKGRQQAAGAGPAERTDGL